MQQHSKMEKLEAAIEWEALEPGFHDYIVTRLGPHTGDLGRLTVQRDDEYGILARERRLSDSAKSSNSQGARTQRILHRLFCRQSSGKTARRSNWPDVIDRLLSTASAGQLSAAPGGARSAGERHSFYLGLDRNLYALGWSDET